jgi:hypothetical protein
MNSVYDMTREQFLKELNTKCRPADILKWAPEIYAYLSGLFTENCSDSVDDVADNNRAEISHVA